MQVISVAGDGATFALHETRLDFVLTQVPPGMRVAVVSVVGAFRTGKSFLLDVLLRYLRWSEAHPGADEADAWLSAASDEEPLEGNELSSAPDYSSTTAAPGSARSGFKWRGGLERMTTGMWLWSRPFVRRLPEAAGGGEVAVLLMDTQGLFDSETGQMLTTCIFGLSALMSSYLIFNVNRQVQEDHLQHLALFTEYGRRVREQQEASAARAAERRAQGAAGAAAGSERRARGGAHASSCSSGGGGSDGEGGDASDQDEDSDDGGIGATDAVAALRQLAAGGDAAGLLPLPPPHAAAARTRPAAVGPPFQCL